MGEEKARLILPDGREECLHVENLLYRWGEGNTPLSRL